MGYAATTVLVYGIGINEKRKKRKTIKINNMEIISERNDFLHFGLKPEHKGGYEVEETKEAWFDGYGVGERLLEGVKFICTVLDDGRLSVKVSERSQNYMSDLNVDKWLKRALDYALDRDVFTGSNGEDDISLMTKDGRYSYEGTQEELPRGIKINKVNL